MNCQLYLHRIADGDQAAFSDLYKAMRTGLLAQARALLAGDIAAAEDAVDEAFMDIWQHAGNYGGRGSANGWIRRIVRNKAIDRLRREGKRESVLPPESFLQISDNAPAQDSHLHEQDTSTRIRTAIGRLSPTQREAVVLCYFNEMPVQEIADATGVPEGTVKTRLHYARKMLQRDLCVGDIVHAVPGTVAVPAERLSADKGAVAQI